MRASRPWDKSEDCGVVEISISIDASTGKIIPEKSLQLHW